MSGADNGRTISELEKDLESKPTAIRAEFIDDPDDGLSDEEKAKIVGSSFNISSRIVTVDLQCRRIVNLSGNWI